jgi:hypothetical protein
MVHNLQHLLELHVQDGYHIVQIIVQLNVKLNIVQIIHQQWESVIQIANNG